MNSIPAECQPYVLMTVIMAVLFIASMIRTWLLRRTEEKLLKNKDALEKHIVQQQKDLMTVRQDANAWRAEMQRQFDLFRHMASDQLKVEEKRFDDLLQKSRDREHQLQTSLDIAKQMCAELPATKARLMQLESVLGLDAGENLTPAQDITLAASEAKFGMPPLPDLDGSPPSVVAELPATASAISEPAQASTDEDLQSRLRHLELQNTQLQQALTAARLRSRIRERSSARGRNGKN